MSTIYGPVPSWRLGKSLGVDLITKDKVCSFDCFSGMGESTLASNLDEAIEVVRAITDLPIAILTNASLLHLKEVQTTLSKLDKVIAKLDAPNSELLKRIKCRVPKLFRQETSPHFMVKLTDKKIKWALVKYYMETGAYA